MLVALFLRVICKEFIILESVLRNFALKCCGYATSYNGHGHSAFSVRREYQWHHKHNGFSHLHASQVTISGAALSLEL